MAQWNSLFILVHSHGYVASLLVYCRFFCFLFVRLWMVRTIANVQCMNSIISSPSLNLASIIWSNFLDMSFRIHAVNLRFGHYTLITWSVIEFLWSHLEACATQNARNWMDECVAASASAHALLMSVCNLHRFKSINMISYPINFGSSLSACN